MTWPDVATHLSPSVVESFEKDMYYVHRQKIYDSIFLVPSPAVFWMSHFLFMSSFLEDRICTMGYPYFQNNAKNYSIYRIRANKRPAAYKSFEVFKVVG